MKFSIQLSDRATKALAKVPKKDRLKIIELIDSLEIEPRPIDCKKLVNRKSPAQYRVRYGHYRIVYSIEDKNLIILVFEIGHRKEIYR